ncbi:hypothetical protein cypCar_00009301, partial [Cyprinus carpio]
LSGITLGSAECAGRPEAMRLVHNAEKQSFSFKKCSAFQFVKRKVRRWMRNPKVNVEKVQAKGFLSPCPKCQEGQDMWYTHFPASYGCCHYSPGGYCLSHPPSPLCQPYAPCTPCQPDKNKTCKVRKWKMLSRHHNDNKVKEAESEGHVICPWTMSPLLGSPVLQECCICNGPLITYGHEEAWQPRQRTKAMDLYYHGDPESDYCYPSDNTFMKQRKMGLNDFIQKLSTHSYACKHPEVQSILNLTPPQDAELMNSNPSPPTEIKNHMFFSPINWDDLNAKKLTPPFNPNVTGPNDLRHFDPEFTDEPVPNSIGCSPDSALVTASITEAAEAFLGFSYAPAMDSYL